MAFIADLKTGHEAEDLLIEILSEKPTNTNFVKNTDPKKLSDYDFTFNFNGRVTTIEVKWDKKSDFTQNLAIEYWNPRQMKYSGILATKADLFAIQIKDRFLIFPTADLKALAFDTSKKFKHAEIDNSTMVLVPISVAQPLAKSININRCLAA